MAKKKKTRKKARTANRLDYTKGGRVGYQVGGRGGINPAGRGGRTRGPSNTSEPEAQVNIPQSELDRAEEEREKAAAEAARAANKAAEDAQQAATAAAEAAGPLTPEKSTIKDEEIAEARDRAKRITESPEDFVKSAELATVEGAKKEEGVIAEGTGQLRTPAPSVTAQQASLEDIAPEQITEVTDVAQVEAPTDITAAQVDVATVGEAPEIEAATGTVSEEAIAKAAGVDRVDPIEAATVEVIPGALTERVVGVLSPEAKAQAAEVAGTDLGRVTRAKKQLRNAGISESVITELGNNPEALEDALMDLTEEERGVIEGLPKEALVSNQMDTLLQGIEDGEIPAWARPAVASVENMLASRGLSASTVGRDALFNAIIQSAIPIAQSNASAIQSAISQERNIEAQVAIKEAEFRQSTALSNAQRVFQFDLAQFNADQQTALSNSKFLQTIAITEAGFDQQSVVQNAILMSQANLAEADLNQRAQIQNAQAFLQMDMANLNNEQQATILQAQQNQQRILSNQSAENAARQFNAASVNQTNQFMADLKRQIDTVNVSQMNAAKEFNASAKNAAEARRINNEVELATINAQLKQDAEKYNAQAQFERDQFNARNALLVEQSNVEWRRQINLAETAAQNEINRQNVQNQFALSKDAQAFLWQEMRDRADFDFRAAQNERDREAQVVATAIGADPGKYANSKDSLVQLASALFGS